MATEQMIMYYPLRPLEAGDLLKNGNCNLSLELGCLRDIIFEGSYNYIIFEDILKSIGPLANSPIHVILALLRLHKIDGSKFNSELSVNLPTLDKMANLLRN